MTSEKAVLLAKLEHLQNCLYRLESKNPFSLQDLETNFDLQDIISVNLQRAIQICVDVATYLLSENQQRSPQSMADAFESLAKLGWISQDLKTQFIKAVGLRNVLVHEYDDIQWDIVYTVVSEHMDVFKKFAKAINEKAHLVDTKG
jgi:uncharacterized protein YutE (UPF0331/DUF86 family)